MVKSELSLNVYWSLKSILNKSRNLTQQLDPLYCGPNKANSIAQQRFHKESHHPTHLDTKTTTVYTSCCHTNMTLRNTSDAIKIWCLEVMECCVKLCWYKSVVCEVVLAQWFKVMLLQQRFVKSFDRMMLCELVNW